MSDLHTLRDQVCFSIAWCLLQIRHDANFVVDTHVLHRSSVDILAVKILSNAVNCRIVKLLELKPLLAN